MATHLLLPDPYESQRYSNGTSEAPLHKTEFFRWTSTSLRLCLRVFVADSTIKGAGQGLFAKTDADKDTVMAFYNGVRITHSEVGAAFNTSRAEIIVLSLL